MKISSYDERFFAEKRKNLKYKMEIGFTLSIEGITRENRIQILTQLHFLY